MQSQVYADALSGLLFDAMSMRAGAFGLGGIPEYPIATPRNTGASFVGKAAGARKG